MELRQLRYFVKAKELMNFTEAKAQLFISQSTLSHQIQRLEQDIGAKLFHRLGKHIHLTEAGERFYDYAIQCLNKANDGLQMLKDLGNVKTGSLIIGTTYGLRHLLTKAVIQFNELYPEIHIAVILGTSNELTEGLKKFETDFILNFEDHQNHRELKYQPLFGSDLGFIMRKDAPLAGSKSISLQEIAALPLALPAKGYITRSYIDEAFLQHQLTPHATLETNDIPILLDFVETGRWYTVMTESTIKNHERLLALPIESLRGFQQAAIISLKDIYEKQSAKAFYEIILNAVT